MGLLGGIFNKKDRKKKLVLHVDDSAVVLKSAALLLRYNLGYDLIQAESADEAIRKAKSQLPDVILLDITMPGSDGFHVLKAVKADPATKHIPVIMCTGRDTAGEVEQSYRLGASGHLTKPLDDEEVIGKKIEEALSGDAGKEAAIRERPQSVQADPVPVVETPPQAAPPPQIQAPQTQAAPQLQAPPPPTGTPAPQAASQGAPAAQPYPMPQYQMPQQPQARTCKYCSGYLTFIPPYNSWYCYPCRRYPDFG